MLKQQVYSDYGWIVVLLCGLAVTWTPLVDACMCDGPKMLHQHFCDSDFVIKTRILRQKSVYDRNSSMPDFPIAIRFDAKTLKVYKLEGPGSKTVDIHNIFTGTTSCGLNFNLEKIYIIAGRIRNGELWAQICDYAALWSSLSHHQVKFIKWKYRKHCDCDIQTNRKRSPSACVTSRSQWSCYNAHSYCEKPAERRVCSWQMNIPLKACLQKFQEP